MHAIKPRGARRRFPPLTREQRRQIRFDMAAGATSAEIEARGLCSATTARALRVGALHPEDGGPIVRLQLPPITKAARKAVLKSALESRRVLGTNPAFKHVTEAVTGGPVLQGRKRVRIHKILAASVRCIDRILKNIGPADPVTGCKLWQAGTREREWTNRDENKRVVRYPFCSDPADQHSLLSPERILCSLASIPLRARQRLGRSCQSGAMCLEVKHFIVNGVQHGQR
jgi:hypothetical protein